MRILVRQLPETDCRNTFIERVVTPYAAGTYADDLHRFTEIRAEMAAHSVAFIYIVPVFQVGGYPVCKFWIMYQQCAAGGKNFFHAHSPS
jgi:hypothetical protein